MLVERFDSFVFYYVLAFFAMTYVLRKNFRHFRIGLLSNRVGESTELRPTVRRTLRVWWAYCWRAVIYRVIAVAVVSFPLGWILGMFASVLEASSFALINLTVQAVIDAVIGMFVIYSSLLDEDISDFRVVLLPLRASTQAAAETLPNASRVMPDNQVL